MAEQSTFNRMGEPAGPPARVAETSIQIRGLNGEAVHAHLLDAGVESTEVGLLRAVCAGLGVNWGLDDLGWWALVPGK